MKKILSAALIASLLVPASATLSTARADDTGRVAAGAAGGFLGGLFLGSVLSHPRPAPPPTYYVAAPEDAELGPVCYWRPGPPYWDGEYGVCGRASACATRCVEIAPTLQNENAPPYIRAGRSFGLMRRGGHRPAR